MKIISVVIALLYMAASGVDLNDSFGGGQEQQTAPAYIIEIDSVVAKQQTGPHDGGGITTGFHFFKDVPDCHFVFKKRILHPGSAIGYHLQKHDEIYYILSGSGELNMNGEISRVGPGAAILTRPGTHHGLKQTGDTDLVIFIIYNREK